MSKTATLKNMRVEYRDGAYITCVGSGATFRAFGASTSVKAAQKLRADIRRDPAAHGIA